MRAVALMVVTMCACGDNLPLPQDAFADEGFGSRCTNPGWSPIAICETPYGVLGMCVIQPNETVGVCRRGCIHGVCPEGQTPTRYLYDGYCYCQP